MMIKRLVCIALLFAVSVTAIGRSNEGPGTQGSSGHFFGSFSFDGSLASTNGDISKNPLVSKLCANQTVVQTLLSRVQQLITTLQSNGSFTQVLADQTNQVAYIQRSNSANLLASDCTGFSIGLINARDADITVSRKRFQSREIAMTALMQIIRSVIGNPGGY